MRRTITNLWNDESGAVGSAEVMFIMTLLCIGMLVGIKSIRDGIITEFADYGQAISNLNQTFSHSPTLPVGIIGTVASSTFTDGDDFCDTSADEDTGAPGSKCVNVCIPAQAE